MPTHLGIGCAAPLFDAFVANRPAPSRLGEPASTAGWATERPPASPSKVDAYVRAECAGDDELHSEIRRMLEEHQRTATLDHPPGRYAPASSAPSVFSPGQLVAGRYRIVRYLSRGGMGEVYEAEHPLLPDRVALKTLLPAIASNEAMIAGFKQEIQLARRIAHPNVCKVFDLEWHEPEGAGGSTILFLTMEFLQGETLSSPQTAARGGAPAVYAHPARASALLNCSSSSTRRGKSSPH